MDNSNGANRFGQPVIQSGWVRALLGLLLFLVGSGVTQILAIWGIAAFTDLSAVEMQKISLNPQSKYYAFVAITFHARSLLTTIGIIYILCRWLDRISIFDLGFALKGHWLELRQGLMTGAGLIAAGFLSLYWTDNLTIEGIEFSAYHLAISFILMVIIAFNEEILVRGYILSNLNQSMNKYVGLALSSVLFAVMHMLNPSWTWISMLNITLAGMVLGVFYIHRKNLWFPIALHFSWNFVQGPITGFEVSGLQMNSILQIDVDQNSWLTGGEFGFEGSVLATILLILTFFWLDRTYRPAEPTSS